MKAYLICIFLTTILGLMAEYFFKKDDDKLGIAMLVISLLASCFIAGVRNINVGTDVRVYVVRLAELSQKTAFLDFVLTPTNHMLFGVCVYLGYLFDDYNILLFFIELLICIPIYLYSYKERKNTSVSVNLLIFMLSMYCVSFNLIRQSLASSICILSYHYYRKGEHKKAYYLVVAASLFHKTALIWFAIYFIRMILQKNTKNKKLGILAILLFTILMPLFITKIISATSFAFYLNNETLMRTFSVGSIIKRLFWLLLSLFILSYSKKDRNENSMAVFMSLFALVFTIMSFSIPGTGRLAYYFGDFCLFLCVPAFIKVLKPHWIPKALILILLFGLWWNMTCVPNDSSNVYPYMSSLCPFLN